MCIDYQYYCISSGGGYGSVPPPSGGQDSHGDKEQNFEDVSYMYETSLAVKPFNSVSQFVPGITCTLV